LTGFKSGLFGGHNVGGMKSGVCMGALDQRIIDNVVCCCPMVTAPQDLHANRRRTF